AAYAARGEAYLDTHRPALALEDFDRAIAASEAEHRQSALYHSRRGRALFLLKRYDLAVAEWKAAREIGEGERAPAPAPARPAAREAEAGRINAGRAAAAKAAADAAERAEDERLACEEAERLADAARRESAARKEAVAREEAIEAARLAHKNAFVARID